MTPTQIRRWPLAARLAAIFALSIAPAAGFVVYNVLNHTAEHLADARDRTTAVARELAQQHKVLTDNAHALLRAIAVLPQLRRASTGQCRSLLQRFLDKDSPYLDLTLAGADGVMRCSARFIDKPMDATTLPYFQRVLATRDFTVGDYQVGRVTGIPILVFGYPVLDEKGGVESVLGAGVPLAFLEKPLAESRLPQGSVIALIGSDRRLIVRIPAARNSPGMPSEMAAAIDAGRDESTVELTGVDGVRRIVTFTKLDYHGRTVYFAAGVPREAVYGPVADRFVIEALALLVTGLAVVFLAWRTSREFIVQPILNVRDAAASIARGEYSARAHPGRPFREAGEMADSFNEMASSIEGQLRKIRRLNRVYAVLSDINGALLRIREKGELVREACRIAAQKGQFALVIIAEIDAAGAMGRVLSHSGAGPEQIDQLRELLARPATGLARSVRDALSREEHLVLNNLRSPQKEPVAALLADMGLGSTAFFPASIAEPARLVFCFGAAEAGFFDDDEVRLLRELAADTGLGLSYIDQATRIDFLQHHDPVTRLPNRDRFEEYLAQALSRAAHRNRYVAVLMLDVNDFRRIVDAMGKHIGDAIVQELAAYLMSCVRDGDMVAALGRDTFGVALCDLGNEADAADVLDKIITGLPSRVAPAPNEVFFTMRIGAAIFPRDGGSADVLLGNAELAMQSVRGEAGTSFAFHSKGADVEAHDRIRIEAALRSAIAGRELSLVYQPIVRVPTRKIAAVEALTRWNSPTLGNVSPARFIPIAEHRNLILPLGDWILESVAQWSVGWRARGLPPLECGVNVSVRQLVDAKFSDRVKSILAASGVDPAEHPLTVEITESQLMAAPEKVIRVLERLREMKISLAIDDFGTGYSSLSYLTRLPINTLKIDQSFIAAIGTPSGLAVVKAVINLAHALNLNVIAEGVETEDQFDQLRRLGCDLAQGFLFSKPLPAQQLESFVTGSIPETSAAHGNAG